LDAICEMSGVEQPGGRDHWSSKPADSVSWYQDDPVLSIRLVRDAVRPPARVLDVGGGASFLVDRLLDAGYTPGVLDIADAPLELVRRRLGQAAAGVTWIVADVREFVATETWDVWHDRAVFHFLTEPEDQAAYRRSLLASTRPGSTVILATFGPEGPTRCSGLPTVRYAPGQLALIFGAGFQLQESAWETHATPTGGQQQFVYCRFKRQ
jgi:2-polyprenyl-3-methyl-5-hydroxy-6-metoxy-1,4-benzoquinol methylase